MKAKMSFILGMVSFGFGIVSAGARPEVSLPFGSYRLARGRKSYAVREQNRLLRDVLRRPVLNLLTLAVCMPQRLSRSRYESPAKAEAKQGTT